LPGDRRVEYYFIAKRGVNDYNGAGRIQWRALAGSLPYTPPSEL